MKQIRKSKTDYKDKIFHHKLTIVYRILLVIVLVAAIAAAVKIYLANQVYTKFEMIKTIDKVGTSDGVFRKYQDNLLTYSKDGISAYDKDGKQLWNQTYEMQEPIVVSRGGHVAVADYKGSDQAEMQQRWRPICRFWIWTYLPPVLRSLHCRMMLRSTSECFRRQVM